MLKHSLPGRAAACLLACAALLTACGGGSDSSSPNAGTNAGTNAGSNTNGGNTTPPATAAALSFSPSVATASLKSGATNTVMVSANVLHPGDFNGPVFAQIVDSAGVLQPNARFEAQTDTQYTAILHTSTTLAPGSYKGNFTINLCKDEGCSKHFPGSPMQLPYEFTVAAVTSQLVANAAGSLNQTINAGAAAPAPVIVAVSGTQLAWTASANVPWISLKNPGGTGNGEFSVGFDNSQSAIGTQSGVITVTASDGQRFVLGATLTTIPQTFTVSKAGFTFTAINGAPIAAQLVDFDLPGGGSWSVNSDSAWLSANPSSGTLPGQLGMAVDASKGTLASGNYTGKLTLHSPNASDRSLPVYLNLTRPTLSASADSIVLGGAYGRDFSTRTVTLYLNTLKNNWPWTFSPLPAWATASATSGQVNQDGAAVQLTPNLANTPLGSSTALLNTAAKVNGDSLAKSIALTINRDQQKILPSETGLAMVSVPGWSRLERTVTVRDNFSANTAWTATSDQAWLKVARSGNQLTLTGDPTSLPDNTTSYATVTLATTAPGVTVPENVRVALWKGTQVPAARTEINVAYTKVIADAIRPLVYVHNGETTIDAYNVYTGQKVATSAGIGNELGDMAVSPNGDRLYVYDTVNRSVVVVDTQNLTKVASWTLSNAANKYSHMLVVRPNGEEVVLTTLGEAFRASNGQRLAAPLHGTMDASRGSRRLYAQDEGLSGSTTMVYDLDYSAIAGGTLHLATVGSFSAGSNGQDIAVGLDGGRVYTANGSPYYCVVTPITNLQSHWALPGGSAYPNNVEVDSFGRIYCGANSIDPAADAWMYDSAGTLLKQFKFTTGSGALQTRQMAVSADGMVLVGVTRTPLLSIMAVGPAN